MVLGASGQGKSASLRNMKPAETLLIQTLAKPLPFPDSRKLGWLPRSEDAAGNIFVTDSTEQIEALMTKTKRKIIVIDDFNYCMSNEFMRQSMVKGYDKFTQIQRSAWNVLVLMGTLPSDVRVYILAHSWTNDQGDERMKTIGKMLDEKDTPEGRFSIVLKTHVTDEGYFFSTRTNGHDPVKTPMGMFEERLIPNDLAAVDAAICKYYGIGA
jgi:hypothetical protein